MWLKYPDLISESVDELAAAERHLGGRRAATKVQLLRLLKSGEARSIPKAVPLVGYSRRQLMRWWTTYQQGGLAALTTEGAIGGKRSQLTADALAALEAEMKLGHIASLQDAQRYLAEEHGIVYHSLNGIWVQFRAHRIKLKTGRRQHRKADPEAQQAFRDGF
jgi:transposase